MKPFGKLFTAIFLFSLGIALPAHAEETQDSLLKALGFQTVAEKTASEEAKKASETKEIASEDPQAAFSQESKDLAQYLAFADKADEEGQPEIGKVFRALARAKQYFLDYDAQSIKALGDTPGAATGTPLVKNTAENLKSALDSELYKSNEMYPGLLAQIPPDHSEEVRNAFMKAGKIAAAHAGLLQEILADNPSKIPVSAYNVCSSCGYVFLDWAEVENCPICGASKDKFTKIN